MNPSSPILEGTSGNGDESEVHRSQKGFIAFCETNLRYEKGFKAWIVLGPYLLGALILETIIGTDHSGSFLALGPWVGFLAYLILFPLIWRRILRFVTSRGTSRGEAS